MKWAGKIFGPGRGEKGSVIVVVAVASAVLFGFLALVADSGLGYLQRQRLDNAVRAAALAGAQELPGTPAVARTVALAYAASNGAATQVEATVSDDDERITVQARRSWPLLLGSFLGASQGQVGARAVARTGPVVGTWGVAPLGIEEHEMQFGVAYVLKQGANSVYESPLGSGNFGALALGGTGSSNYERNLLEGFNSLLQLGVEVATESGNMSGATLRAVNSLIAACPHSVCTPDNIPRDCPRLVIIPIYVPVGERNQIKYIRVTGFAAFHLEEVTGTGIQSEIRGYFVPHVAAGLAGEGEASYGLRAVRLVE